LVSDALQRRLTASDIVCARGGVAHATDDDALTVYTSRHNENARGERFGEDVISELT
jgi:hypothetical protein